MSAPVGPNDQEYDINNKNNNIEMQNVQGGVTYNVGNPNQNINNYPQQQMQQGYQNYPQQQMQQGMYYQNPQQQMQQGMYYQNHNQQMQQGMYYQNPNQQGHINNPNVIVLNKYKETIFPPVSPGIAYLILFLNIFFPGLGTFILACHSDNPCYWICTGLAQMALAACIIGWIWAIVIGITCVNLSYGRMHPIDVAVM